jgi:hypothetical protein
MATNPNTIKSKIIPSVQTEYPFEIMENPNSTAKDPKSNSTNATQTLYVVAPGSCFSTFSFDTGTFVPIKYPEPFTLKEDTKIYIEIDVLPNLQVKTAEIKCQKVNEKENWPTYPTFFQIEPQDEVDDKGRVKKILDGKKQTKCYVLIGYSQNDVNKAGVNTPTPVSDAVKNSKSTPVQILKSDIILLASVVSGVPIIFPAPYLNAYDHLKAISENAPTKD